MILHRPALGSHQLPEFLSAEIGCQASQRNKNADVPQPRANPRSGLFHRSFRAVRCALLLRAEDRLHVEDEVVKLVAHVEQDLWQKGSLKPMPASGPDRKLKRT